MKTISTAALLILAAAQPLIAQAPNPTNLWLVDLKSAGSRLSSTSQSA